ncbi:MAG: exopolysaccharide biosynthesis protein [Sphingomonas bacterium]|uniref:AAA family ATPase n=1 Tax=Sphingomonas bacterium TaxID=1895847 RepID=UPI002605BBF9|nr:AAA family ATPase [Sphingomonas bacterium]MDB5703146.1 exopolysaccharide biosynthesis protein [Sphingomonas bacterium]
MTDLTPRKMTGSLLERAAELYDFGTHLRPARQEELRPEPQPIRAPAREPVFEPVREEAPLPRAQAVVRSASGVAIDRAMLAEKGLLVPGAPIGALVEEFRQVKRQLLQTARIVRKTDGDRSRTILVCSAKPNDGKTYCAINLAIAMAAERDVEVLLVDADFAKPDVMKRLGLNDGPGLLDALADPRVDVESCVIRTDIPQLSLLPAGTKSNTDTELLASKRTGEIVAALLAADPRRLVIFDSPPALAASPASLLSNHAGQVMLVVRADRTSEGDLRDAVAQLDGCEHIQLVLNAVSFAPGGRRFGSYYGQEDAT